MLENYLVLILIKGIVYTANIFRIPTKSIVIRSTYSFIKLAGCYQIAYSSQKISFLCS